MLGLYRQCAAADEPFGVAVGLMTLGLGEAQTEVFAGPHLHSLDIMMNTAIFSTELKHFMLLTLAL